MTMTTCLSVVYSLGLLAAALSQPACGASQPAPAASAMSTVGGAPASTVGETHTLVIAAAACWFGGTWADALGAQDSAKQGTVEARCHELERRVWGGAEDRTHYEQLRALDENAVADVIATVHETAKQEGLDSPRRKPL
jgi:hypothetical protein